MKYLRKYENININFDDIDEEEYDLLDIKKLYIYVDPLEIGEFIFFMENKGFSINKKSFSPWHNGFVFNNKKWQHVGLTTNPTLIKKSKELIKFSEVKKLYGDKIQENINFDEWDEEEFNNGYDKDNLTFEDLYKIKLRCKVHLKNVQHRYKYFTEGNIYKVNKIYGDPQGAHDAGYEKMHIDFVKKIELRTNVGTYMKFSLNKNDHMYLFNYFEIA